MWRLEFLWKKLKQAKLLWIAVFPVPIVPYILTSIMGSGELAITFSGLLFELSGIFLVAWGFNELRTQHGHTTFREICMKWLREFGSIFERRTHINISIESILPSFGMSASGSVVTAHGANANISIQDQIKELKKEMSETKQKIAAAELKLGADIKSLRKDTSIKLNDLREAIDKLSQKLDVLVFGDEYLEFLGLFWVAVGLLYSTIPEIWEPIFT